MNGEENSNLRYYVQVGVFNQYNNARNLAYPLEVLGYPVRIVRRGESYVVQVGDVDTLAEGNTLEEDLNILGYDTLLLAE